MHAYRLSNLYIKPAGSGPGGGYIQAAIGVILRRRILRGHRRCIQVEVSVVILRTICNGRWLLETSGEASNRMELGGEAGWTIAAFRLERMCSPVARRSFGLLVVEGPGLIISMGT